MIKYETAEAAIPPTLEETIVIIKEYGEAGWRLAAMYSGLMFFQRKVRTRVV